jgi:hypothetical protein
MVCTVRTTAPCDDITAIYPLHVRVRAKVKSTTARHGGACGETRYSSYSFLTSALDGVSDQRHALAALCPRTEGWVDPTAGLDTETTGKILLPLPGIETRSPRSSSP